MEAPQTVIDLGGNLVLRSVRDDSDIARLVEMYTREQNPVEGRTAASLLAGSGRVRRGEYLLVEDTATGRIASTTCLIRWAMRFGGTRLSCAQVEMVYTSPAWRNRGLVRRQMERLHELAHGEGFDILIIWGIPNYYRQFGYSYAVEGAVSETLDASAVPGGPAGNVRLRPAEAADIPAMRRFHDALFDPLDVAMDRGDDHWRYMVECARQPVLVVERGGEPAGYLVASPLGRTIRVLENAAADTETAMGVLRLLAQGYEQVVARWPRQGAVAQLLQSMGSTRRMSSQWLIRVPDIAGLLSKLAPELDRRLAAAAPRKADADLVVNLYRDAVRIGIRAGRVASVEKTGPVDTTVGGGGADLSIPADAFVRLLFGQAGVDELYTWWPDTLARDGARPLVEVLFPRLEAYLSTPYHAYGPGFDGLDDSVRALYL